MEILKKTYTSDVVQISKEGSFVTGSLCIKVWLWRSPSYAHSLLHDALGRKDRFLVNFRRVK